MLVWLVADGARWALWAEGLDGTVTLSPAPSASRLVVLEEHQEEAMLGTYPYDAPRHRPGTAAQDGHCSWHGPVSCPQPLVISFQDAQGIWQSGCQRAVDELTARGWISTAQEQGEE